MGQHRKTRRKRNKTKPNVLVAETSEFRLPPENDNGNIEYKSSLIKPTLSRIQHLVTQMKWRLHEGQGEAIYEIGVEDNGNMKGLVASELSDSMDTMYKMAASAGASLFILSDRCVHGEPDDPECRRVLEILVRKLPANQQFADMRVALLGSASSGKSTLSGVLTQGVLDNGAGKCRLNLLRYMHEIRSGKTSSVTIDCFGFSQDGEVLNYKENDLKNILECSTKLVTLIDLAGDKRYLRTTIYGLSGYSPHYCALLVNARIGWTAMSSEHLVIANAFDIPVFVIITKIDLVKQQRIEEILHQIQSAMDRSQKCMKIRHVLSDEDSIYAVHSISNIVPVFSISNVTGENLNLLTKFLNLLPNRNVMSAGTDSNSGPLFYIDEIFNLPEIGTVLCGLVATGTFNEGELVQLGPNAMGNYRLGKIKSLQRNKQPVLKIHAGEAASIAIEFVTKVADFEVRKGMVLLSHKDRGLCCRRFLANFKLISHSVDEIGVGFQGTAYIGSLQRTVTIVNVETKSIRLHEPTNVTFEFYGGPEFVLVGSTLFFRERDTKGIGEILEIPDS